MRVSFLFGTQKKRQCLVFALKIHHEVNHLINEHLKHFVAARDTKTSVALGELTLVIPRCRTDYFCRSFLSAAAGQWNELPSGVFSGGYLSSFKSAVNSCLLRA